MTNRTNRALLAILPSVLALDSVGNAAADDLAKASQNPVGDIVSVPIELWHHGGMPGDSSADI